MAERQQHQNWTIRLERHQLYCSLSLELLKEPATLLCGHSYCLSCTESCWKQEKGRYSCPQGRETGEPRSILCRNNTLAEAVEELKKTSTQQAATSALTCAGPEDVACDFCCETKPNKASMTCLTCLASYCPAHLTAHYRFPVLKTHQLVSALFPLKHRMCKEHNKLMEIYCETDPRFVCPLCYVDEHRNHNRVTTSAQKVNIKEKTQSE